jgi:hypothetical protein
MADDEPTQPTQGDVMDLLEKVAHAPVEDKK